MLTAEESRILHYLLGHASTSVAELVRVCLPGASAPWVDRLAANLDWLGYVVAYHGEDGQVSALQITDQGRLQVDGSVFA